ncbi:transposable element Tc1 transposase [Trichonephila clavipes]|nr:transposable element Tc1 transposase [Trichonephila clavipes]
MARCHFFRLIQVLLTASRWSHPCLVASSARYISGVLEPLAFPDIRSQRNPTFQQDNAQPHVFGIVRTFHDMENVQPIPCPACSPDLSPIENVSSMVAQRLACHHTVLTTVDELWYRV